MYLAGLALMGLEVNMRVTCAFPSMLHAGSLH